MTEEATANPDPLRRVVHEIEKGASRLGWDRPPTIYALVPTPELLAAPDLPADVADQLRAGWDGDPHHLSAILQDPLAEDNLEEVLPQLQWPETVGGAAVSVERVILPPEAESQIPDDPEDAANFVADHPNREDVRLTVGVLRDGRSWCAVRTRAFDDDSQVGAGAELVPELIELLSAGFEADANPGTE